ncbi:allophanate hydrolase [Corynebacterium sp. 13CS0277]|uniref:5-oxoprolinase subunit C family protein n=1 Tax=Corynebacterium sp. 13CS0277 TaxID=2071994 RepID=UPI000D03CBB0|nr:biotin-dependent carboxyltransferase family protein [Corynebacterium sp. 13CS0277]PRQ11255.1 allophanate hydrolase [Corynebacterium sp. 13CS0277]
MTQLNDTASVAASRAVFTVTATGPQALFQDRGRPGHASTGISASGHFDRMSAARANHALGNSLDAPLIECFFGGLELEVHQPTYIIATGVLAPITITQPDGVVRTRTTNDVLRLQPGDHVRIGQPEFGLRAYVAVRGGFDAPRIIGSASRDVLSGLGPAPLAVGDTLGADTTGAFIEDPDWLPIIDHLVPLWRPTRTHTLEVIPGPRDYWFTTESILNLFSQTFTVNSSSNRIGVRLDAEKPLERRPEMVGQELASEGMVRGCIQVPPDGNPVLFGPDHPVTGGYPVIGVLSSSSSDRCAQLAPGDSVRFAPVPSRPSR